MAIRSMIRGVFVLCFAATLGSCSGYALAAPHAKLTVSNITKSACVTNPGGGVTCTLVMDVTLSNATLSSGHVTMITTGLLVYIDGAQPATNANWTFREATLVHQGVACVSPQTTLALYDGETYDSSPLVASTQIGPISFSCN